jgi:hypothetical protein
VRVLAEACSFAAAAAMRWVNDGRAAATSLQALAVLAGVPEVLGSQSRRGCPACGAFCAEAAPLRYVSRPVPRLGPLHRWTNPCAAAYACALLASALDVQASATAARVPSSSSHLPRGHAAERHAAARAVALAAAAMAALQSAGRAQVHTMDMAQLRAAQADHPDHPLLSLSRSLATLHVQRHSLRQQAGLGAQAAVMAPQRSSVWQSAHAAPLGCVYVTLPAASWAYPVTVLLQLPHAWQVLHYPDRPSHFQELPFRPSAQTDSARVAWES